MKYIVNIDEIERALLELGGEATTNAIQDHILKIHCRGEKPDNYASERSFRMTVQRKMQNYCPDAKDFDATRREGRFRQVSRGLYRTAVGHKDKEFAAIEEVPDAEMYYEGATKTIAVNYYERSEEARKRCIEHYGVKCIICEFNFEKTYGEIGRAFIHVHHIVALSEIKSSYEVNPINDLRPVCANCHAIIHRTIPALAIDQLQQAFEAERLI